MLLFFPTSERDILKEGTWSGSNKQKNESTLKLFIHTLLLQI